MIPAFSATRAVLRAIAYLLVTLPLMPVQAVAVALRLPLARRLPRIYHRLAAGIIGVDVAVEGEPFARRPVLFVGNHVSYLDITALSAVTDCSFVAKAEIAGWPLFGWLAKLQRTVFIERRASRAADQRDEIKERLNAGDNLVIFPEGTSNDGIHVRPFKSALFAVAEREVSGRHVTVQPFSLAYTRLDGVPVGREWRPLYAWYGDMDLPGHLWRMLGLGRVRAEVILHAPVTIDDFRDRKAMAEHCERVVAEGVAWANSGRPPPAASAGRPVSSARPDTAGAGA